MWSNFSKPNPANIPVRKIFRMLLPWPGWSSLTILVGWAACQKVHHLSFSLMQLSSVNKSCKTIADFGVTRSSFYPDNLGAPIWCQVVPRHTAKVSKCCDWCYCWLFGLKFQSAIVFTRSQSLIKLLSNVGAQTWRTVLRAMARDSHQTNVKSDVLLLTV